MTVMRETMLTASGVDLAASLQLLPVSQETWMFLERVPVVYLSDGEREQGIHLTTYEAATDWSEWQRGRVFCAAWELRWEGAAVTYTGAQVSDLLAAGFRRSDLLEAASEPRAANYYLWGERAGDYFADGRIPRRLDYPVAEGSRVMLSVLEWFGSRGEPVAWRASGLEAVP